jgi:drug/metabolite transporter (DMT)-like permease
VSEGRAYVLLVAVLLLWAGHFPVGKLGVAELGPLTLTAGRALLATPWLLVAARLDGPLARPLVRRDLVAFVVLALTGLVGNTTLWFWGLKYTTPINAGILGAVSPVVVAVVAALLLGDRLRALNWLGIALGAAGVLVTVSRGSLAVLLTLSFNRGDLIVLLSHVAWIAYTVYSRAAASTLPPAAIQAGAHVVSGLVLIPLSLLVDGAWPSLRAAPAGWAVVLYGAVPVTLGHLWYYAVIRTIGPGRAAVFLNLMPFTVIALSWLALGERVYPYHLVGALVVIAGVFLTTRRRR